MKLNRLKEVLTEEGRTNKWLAEKVGKSQVSVSRWCSNTTQPSLVSLYQIALLLEVDIRDLITPTKTE